LLMTPRSRLSSTKISKLFSMEQLYRLRPLVEGQAGPVFRRPILW
jgi:hypothetical protein